MVEAGDDDLAVFAIRHVDTGLWIDDFDEHQRFDGVQETGPICCSHPMLAAEHKVRAHLSAAEAVIGRCLPAVLQSLEVSEAHPFQAGEQRAHAEFCRRRAVGGQVREIGRRTEQGHGFELLEHGQLSLDVVVPDRQYAQSVGGGALHLDSAPGKHRDRQCQGHPIGRSQAAPAKSEGIQLAHAAKLIRRLRVQLHALPAGSACRVEIHRHIEGQGMLYPLPKRRVALLVGDEIGLLHHRNRPTELLEGGDRIDRQARPCPQAPVERVSRPDAPKQLGQARQLQAVDLIDAGELVSSVLDATRRAVRASGHALHLASVLSYSQSIERSIDSQPGVTSIAWEHRVAWPSLPAAGLA